MMVDEKGRLFSKISIIDLVIVLLMVVAIAFVGVKILGLNDKIGAINVKTETYQITFKVNNVRQATVDALEKSVGEEVTDVWAASLGKLTKINSVTPVMTNIANDDGSFRQVEVPERFCVEITMEVSGKQTTDSIILDNNRKFSVGSNMTIQTKQIAVETAIIKIDKK